MKAILRTKVLFLLAIVVLVSSSGCGDDSTAPTVDSTIPTVDPPLANAGADQTVAPGTSVTLDGTQSSSTVSGAVLTYEWSFVEVPEFSGTTLSDTSSDAPSFLADTEGTYVVQLIVSDGVQDSLGDEVSIFSEFFTDPGNGTIIDNTSGLVWLKDGNCYGAVNWPFSVDSLSSGSCGLNDGSVAGDWRIPSKSDFDSICNGAIFGIGFDNFQDLRYWTSTPSSSGPYNWACSPIAAAFGGDRYPSTWWQNASYVLPVRDK